MVARHTTPPAIDLAGLDDPLADALRTAARGDQPVQLTDGGRLLAQITPIQPTEPSDTSAPPDDADARYSLAHVQYEDTWDDDSRRALPRPYIFDPAENELVLARRSLLIEQLRGAFPEGVDAVELIREQRGTPSPDRPC